MTNKEKKDMLNHDVKLRNDMYRAAQAVEKELKYNWYGMQDVLRSLARLSQWFAGTRSSFPTNLKIEDELKSVIWTLENSEGYMPEDARQELLDNARYYIGWFNYMRDKFLGKRADDAQADAANA